MIAQIVVFWVLTPYGLVGVLEVHAALFFMVRLSRMRMWSSCKESEVMSCSLVGYQCFRATCCLQVQGQSKNRITSPTGLDQVLSAVPILWIQVTVFLPPCLYNLRTSSPYSHWPWKRRQQVYPKQDSATKLHGITIQMFTIWILMFYLWSSA
jgi:hypothetical protein